MTIRTQTRGYRASEAIARAVDTGEAFRTGGSLSGDPVRPGWASLPWGHWMTDTQDRARFDADRDTIRYVIKSYNTPIAWVTRAPHGDTAYIVKQRHSVTTSRQTTTVAVALTHYAATTRDATTVAYRAA